VFYAIRADGTFDTNDAFDYHTHMSSSLSTASEPAPLFQRVISDYDVTVEAHEIPILLDEIALILEDTAIAEGARAELQDFVDWVRWVLAEEMTILATGV
jgi:hypothetical protein